MISVRPLTPADRSAWEALWEGYLAFYKTSLPAEIKEVAFARLIGDDPHDYNGLLAEVDAKPVGLAHFLFHRHGWRIGNVCYLQDLYATPETRGTGVGRALLDAVYDAAAAQGAEEVYWMTQTGNADARRLYDRAGQATDFIKYRWNR